MPIPVTLPYDAAFRYLGFSQDVTQAAYILGSTTTSRMARLYGFDLASGEMQWEVNLDDIAEWHTGFVEGTIGVNSFPMDNLAWSSQGQIAISGNFLAIYTPDDDSLRVLTPESEKLIHHLEWSPDGHYLAVVVGKTVEIWDNAAGERVEVTYSNTEADANRNPYALAWHPDGTRLVVSFILGSELEAFDVSHLYEDA
jgi:WD40 repeat protein